ncbi:DUF3800 domain-containing protein [Streptomyces scabiei]|uniref:DUF3800 domain-containing protein n=1 Tax=Streptomyces scabiei TaxID=1930 RepID=UPI001B3056C5|nr:DUF3800 domain-containing protein [Streptomyces sp. LBUM 1475]
MTVTVSSSGQAPKVRRLHAFIDEAGVRSHSPASGDYFVMTAVIVADEDLVTAQQFLAGLRRDLGRLPGHTLHWVNFKKHEERVHAAKMLGGQDWATISSVIVCKRHLGGGLDETQAYLYTLRYLLERLSWLARDTSAVLTYTLAHIVRMQLASLRQYEAVLQSQATNIAWSALDPKGGKMDQPNRIELLQCADLAASATFQAFNLDRFGNTEPRYLQELAPRLYRRGAGPCSLTSYGMKMHPWNANTKAAYPWVAAL